MKRSVNIVLDLYLHLDICFIILFCVDLDDYFVIDK